MGCRVHGGKQEAGQGVSLCAEADLPDWLSLLLPIVAAPFIGSFLGVLIRRLPDGRPVVLARSACEGCGATLSALEMVPLASFSALRGRCRRCGAAIGWFHPAVELAATGVAVWAVLAAPDPAEAWTDCVLGWGLLALAWIDWQHMRLPDAITLPLVLLGLAATWWLAPWDITDHAVGTAIGYLGFRAVAGLYRWWRGRDGLGQGDAKLLAAAGAWVGWAALPTLIFTAALLGLLLALAEKLRGRSVGTQTMLPFGPCLAVALWLIRLYGMPLGG